MKFKYKYAKTSRSNILGCLVETQNKKLSKAVYNHFYNILRLFAVLPNFPFTTSETMGDYYKDGMYELPHELPNDLRLRILGN